MSVDSYQVAFSSRSRIGATPATSVFSVSQGENAAGLAIDRRPMPNVR
jgi:hypothetical protein